MKDTYRGPDRGESPPLRRRLIECEECGTRHYWCDACERATCRHIVEAPEAPVEAKLTAEPASLETLAAFVAWILAEIGPEARLVELTETPDAAYSLRIEIPREIPKSLVVPKCLIDSAVTFPLSLRTLRNILHTDVLGMAHTRAVSDVRRTRAERFRLICSFCFQPISPKEGLRLQQGDPVHIGCARH